MNTEFLVSLASPGHSTWQNRPMSDPTDGDLSIADGDVLLASSPLPSNSGCGSRVAVRSNG
eukprot:5497979-Pyramimonas_sp.AAC.1